MRPLILLSALLLTLGAAETPPAPVPPASAAVVKAKKANPLDVLWDEAQRLGFPDLRGARFFVGKVKIRYEMGGKHEGPAMDQDGVHLLLADGRWLVDCVNPPQAMQRVDQGEATPITASELRQRWQAKGQEGMPLANVVQQDCQAQMESPLLLLAILQRAGLPDLDEALAQAIAQAPAPSSAPLGIDDDSHGFSVMSGFDQHVAQATQVRPADAIRRALADKAAWQLVGGMGGMQTMMMFGRGGAWWPAERVAEALKAMAPADARDEAEALVAAAALSTSATAAAPLDERIAVWHRLSEQERQMAEQLGRQEIPAELPAEMRQMIEAQLLRIRAADLVQAADLDALFALLDDPRPSRWIEGNPYNGGRPLLRTRGDNALRAIVHLLGFDPRLAVERDPAAAWTADERRACTSVLRAWWAERRGREVGAIAAEVAPRLRLDALAALLRGLDASKRAPIAAALASAWKTGPPAPAQESRHRFRNGGQDESIDAIFDLLGGDPVFAAAAATWNPDGAWRGPWAVWQDAQGRPAPFDTWMEATLSGDDAEACQAVMQACCRRPTPLRLARLQETLASTPAMPGALVLSVLFNQGLLRPSSSFQRMQEGIPPRQQALVLALIIQVAGDRRPLSEAWIQREENHAFLKMGEHRQYLQGGKPAGDLRYADLALLIADNQSWFLGIERERTMNEEERNDLGKPLADRDALLNDLDRRLRDRYKAVYEAAGLPAEVKKPVKSADKDALF